MLSFENAKLCATRCTCLPVLSTVKLDVGVWKGPTWGVAGCSAVKKARRATSAHASALLPTRPTRKDARNSLLQQLVFAFRNDGRTLSREPPSLS
jgi:hypothetical protein